MILFVKLFRESALFAWTSVLANKLRTLLTLLGITIGIFAIISVFSVVDALENQIRSSIASLGDDVIYIQKWPWAFDSEYPWWRYMNRPNPKVSEIEDIRRRSHSIDNLVFTASARRTVEYGSRSLERTVIFATSHEYDQIRVFDLQEGRYFSAIESAAGRNLAILGASVAENLFQGAQPVGETIKVFGRKIEVIGVFEQEGNDPFGNSHDELIMLPVNFVNSFINVESDQHGPAILAKSRPGISNEEMTDELRGIMRSIRSIRPGQEENFALNETSLLSNQFDGLFAILKIAGWIIGGFSILVGGFGIANIMFVSVKERTSIIGIQKALGAKNYFILLQFLFESVMLSLLGGAVGLLLVMGGSFLASQAFSMDLLLTRQNVLLGINVSVIIGIIAGFVPAFNAARLNPVDAIRSNG